MESNSTTSEEIPCPALLPSSVSKCEKCENCACCTINNSKKTAFQRIYSSMYTWTSLSFVAGLVAGGAIGYRVKK